MSIYVVGYDLRRKDVTNYEELFKAIKSLGTWWHCLDSTWLVASDSTSVAIRDYLWQHMHADDRLLVARYGSSDSAWVGFTGDCATWLKNNM